MGNLTRDLVISAGIGRHSDGEGLVLEVKSATRKTWILRVQVDGKRRDYGLGSVRDLSLAKARQKAIDWRRMIKEGIDPRAITAPTGNAPTEAAAPTGMTFRKCAEALHGELIATWKHADRKHGAQWLASLEQHVFPILGNTAVDAIGVPEMRAALMPVWLAIPETARRLRQRICATLDWAHANGYRDSEAPQRSLNRMLPRQPKRDGHHAAMPYVDVPAFFIDLRKRVGMSRLAVEFLILTAARSGEIRGARWTEIDMKRKIWSIPADRMKAGREHRVPLSEAALDLLRRADTIRPVVGVVDGEPIGSELIFPGLKDGPLSDMSLSKILRLEKRTDCTIHGFRSSFRDWSAERTATPREVVEAALAHTNPNKVESAYLRSDFFDHRRSLMDAWATFVTGIAGKPQLRLADGHH
jgi:integrase